MKIFETPWESLAKNFVNEASEKILDGWHIRTFGSDVNIPPWDLTEILPSRNRLEDEILIFELMGYPRAGKSSFINQIKHTGVDDTYVMVVPEFHFLGEDIRPILRIIREKYGREMAAIAHDKYKLLSVEEVIVESILLYKMMREDSSIPTMPILIFIERGPHDVLAHTMYLARHIENKREKEILTYPSVDINPGLAYSWIKNYTDALDRADIINGVLLYQNKIETAKRRRVQDGLEELGYMTNPETFDQLDIGYGTWHGGYSKFYIENRGMGLKIIDGERPLAENNKDVYKYIVNIVEQHRELLKL